MILFLHHRYRTTGGEERVVEDLLWLVREVLGEDAELLERDSASMGRLDAARGLLAGGLRPGDVGGAVRLSGARVVHAHNLNPTYGRRALAAAREAGARVVLHLHNYRLVCAVGTCFNSRQEDCTRCQGRNTWPGVRLNCRGTGPEAVAYGASLALHSVALAAHADVVVVPSQAALERLRALRAPLPWDEPHRIRVIPPVVRACADDALARPAGGTYALVASRLAPEKGVETAIDACNLAGLRLVVAGDGPLAAQLRLRAEEADVEFTGAVDAPRLAELRAGAALALAPSRSAETFGLSAAEAMACALPVAGSSIGALTDLLPADALVPPGDARCLAAVAQRLFGDVAAGKENRERISNIASPRAVADALREAYDA